MSTSVCLGAQATTFTLDELHDKQGLWRCGEPEVKGEEMPLDAFQGEFRALRVSYDFSACTTRANRFVRLNYAKPLPGIPRRVVFRAYAAAAGAPVVLALWLLDCNGEQYLARQTLDWSGWGDLVFDIPSAPAWASGDRNGRVDYPLRIEGLSVDVPERAPLTGTLVLSTVLATSVLDRDTCLGLMIRGTAWNWGEPAIRLGLTVVPYSGSEAIDTYTCRVVAHDAYHDRAAATAEFRLQPPFSATISRQVVLDLPYGLFDCRAELRNALTGAWVAAASVRVFSAVKGSPDAAIRAYETRWSPVGGVFGFLDLELADAWGARWARALSRSWRDAKTETDVAPVVAEMAPLARNGIRMVMLQALYDGPPDNASGKRRSLLAGSGGVAEFSTAYGKYMAALAAAAGGPTFFEIGNEDNGSTKYLYTEVARNAAAGIRAARPLAVIANSGTAFVDHDFLRMQARRGLFDYLDALCVHPYTNNSTACQAASPERCETLERLYKLEETALDMGGMKELWATEYGWPNGDAKAEAARADLYLREMVIGEAAGLPINGIYTFCRDYGIGMLPAGVALRQFARFREGRRLAGLLRQGGVWIAVYERGGEAAAIAWTPDDTPREMPLRGEAYYDLFGNRLPTAAVRVSQGPVFIEGVGLALLRQAVLSRCERWKAMLDARVAAMDHAPPVLSALPQSDTSDWQALEKVLLDWAAAHGSVPLGEQAILDLALKWYGAAVRVLGAAALAETAPETQFPRDRFESLILALNHDDVDLPALRHLLRLAERVEADRAICANAAYQTRCTRELATLAQVGERLARDGRRVQFAVFTNLFMEHDGSLGERLRFVPGKPATVRARLTSFATSARTATLALTVPPGWTCVPATAQVSLQAGGTGWLEFVLTCPSGADGLTPVIATTAVPGRPDQVATFDDLKIVPAIEVEIRPLAAAPPQEKLVLVVTNQEKAPVSGSVKLLPPGVAGKPLAIVPFTLDIGQQKDIPVVLQQLPEPVRQTWQCDAHVALQDGRRFTERRLDVDFVCATPAPAGMRIPGGPDCWQRALPLRLDRDGYTLGSYGNQWSPADCSATTFLMWDERHLYFRASVRDQTFNQQAPTGDTLWLQDSVQLIFARDLTDGYHGITLALAAAGPMVWSERAGRLLTEASASITYADRMITYEVAIPWAVLDLGCPGPPVDGTFRYGVAVNDDDAITGRRFLERFKGSIVHGKDVASFATVRLLAAERIPGPAAILPSGCVLFDDFESYPVGTLPGYDAIVSNVSPEAISVVDAQGRTGASSRCLRVVRQELKPHHYALVLAELTVDPGREYLLSAWVKAGHAAPGAALIGICSDRWGNCDYSYAQLPANAPGWERIEMRFKGFAAGRANFIVRTGQTDTVLIDEVCIAAVP